MAAHRFSPVLRHIHAVSGGAADDLPDPLLLDRFHRHGDEAAFAALVRRHGPMVLGVCRRQLSDLHAAEDAFQATFLLLVRKARFLRRPDRLGPWLYGVARRTAAKARALASRRREVAAADVPARPAEGEQDARELRPVIDGAIARLPARYRTPVVLCYLQGLTYAQAAEHLGCPPGTVATRLSRAKDRLRILLLRQGVAPAMGLLAAALTPDATAEAVPAELARTAVRLALAFAAGRAGVALIPANVLTLTRHVGQAMILDKLKILAALAALGVAGTGAGALVYHTAAAEPPTPVDPPAIARAPAVGGGVGGAVAVADKSREGEQSIPLVLLRQKPPDTYRVDAGDLLGVFVEGVLGARGEAPPIIQLGFLAPSDTAVRPAIGFPISVQDDGTLPLPLIDRLQVRGKSLSEIENMVRNAYQQARILPPNARVIVSLARQRSYRVTVVRPNNVAATLDLPAYENDVLNALTRSGGLPGTLASAVIIQRGSTAPMAEGGTVATAVAGVQQIRIPLRLRPDSPLPFKPGDIVLKNGDVILVELAEPKDDHAGDAAPESHRPGGGPPATALAVAAPDGRVLVQMPGTGAWRLFGTAQVQALETDGRPIDGPALADRLHTMTTVLVAADGHKPDAAYLRVIKPGTPVLVIRAND